MHQHLTRYTHKKPHGFARADRVFTSKTYDSSLVKEQNSFFLPKALSKHDVLVFNAYLIFVYCSCRYIIHYTVCKILSFQM